MTTGKFYNALPIPCQLLALQTHVFYIAFSNELYPASKHHHYVLSAYWLTVYAALIYLNYLCFISVSKTFVNGLNGVRFVLPGSAQ